MRPRQGTIEVFSTFLQFDADRFSAWATEPKLRRSMKTCMERIQQMDSAENFWVLYWYKLWQTQSANLAQMHLAAYLQEVCYWAAHKTIASFSSSSQYTLSDCFQMAITKLDKVLKGFNPNLGYNFKNYASAIFSSVLKDILRQHQEVDICTNWSLLRKLSQKRLIESLQNAGLNPDTIACYVLAWNCFKTIYVPTGATGTRKLPKPDPTTWEEIAEFYNKERLSQLHPSGKICSAQTIEKWMIACAKAARSYLYPTYTSINAPSPGQESGELLDSLVQFAQETFLTEIIAQEEEQSRRSQQIALNTVLSEALAKLDPQAQSILQLYYRQSLTQQQIAQELNTKQYTVSRRLTKSKETLLIAVGRWSQETLHITATSDVLNYINTVLEEWLKLYYSHPPSHMESHS